MPEFPGEHAFNFFRWLLDPATLSTISLYSTSMGIAGRWVWKKLEARQNEDLKNLKNDVRVLSDNVNGSMISIQRDMLRLQIITGINSGRLSVGEITMLYDQYKEKGGNSYISRLVEHYLEEHIDDEHH